MNQTAQLLLKWIRKSYEGKYHDKRYCYELAQKVSREYWDKYGEKVIKRSLNHNTCTNRRKFEQLCKSYQELTK